MKKLTVLLGFGLILALLLPACDGLPFEIPWLAGNTPTPTLTAGEKSLHTPTPEITITEEATPGPVTELTVWVPPDLDPNLETDASRLFANQLQIFSELKGGITINVRIKAAGGTGGLMDSLTATSSAAPDALPDLITLSRSDLETAALKGLIFPLEAMTEIPDDQDWYGFTRDMALLQGSTFGLPFAADALILIYRPLNIPHMPESWEEIIKSEMVLTFPVESDQALFPLTLYQSAGGKIQDNQRRPVLEVNPLAEVFRLFADGVLSGSLPERLNQYQTYAQVWTAFREGQSDLAVTWASDFLKQGPADSMVVPLFPMSKGAISYGTGLSWAVATPQNYRQLLAVELAEFLVQPDFLSKWTEAAGYMPSRPSSLEAWQNQSLRSVINQVALMAQLQPSNDIITSLGPILRDNIRQVLQKTIDPAQAAQVAVESLEEQ